MLLQLEQFRHTLGAVTGKGELHSAWPIRIVAFKSVKQAGDYGFPSGLAPARDTLTGVAVASQALPVSILRDCAHILIDASMGRLPEEIESGLLTLFSTLQVDGSRITFGQPPAAADRDKNWARMHMLAVTTEYYGKLRVLVHNLEQGVEAGPAYRNAFG